MSTGIHQLRVFFLGLFHIVRPGEIQPIAVGSGHKAWSLFKYLLFHRGTAIATSDVMDLFWPNRIDSDDTSPLRTAISRLKRTLEPNSQPYSRSSYIICTRDYCAFNTAAPLWVDAEEFEKKCNIARKTDISNPATSAEIYFDALSMYRGDFLAEDVYVDWTMIPREHYRRLFLESSRDAARRLLDAGDLQRARIVLERALQVDRFAEEMHLTYLKVLLELGENAAVVEHYTYCTRLFYIELGVLPSPELLKAYDKAKEGLGTTSQKISRFKAMTVPNRMKQNWT
ncbi:MAG TPA: BTAD domain-containing putative transcriptional regulator [Bacillota bacterium]|nr:BTAD domain-containing putative transcriptional regulator [Bacillota bacterium]